MAGWSSPDRERIKWDGTIEASNGFIGDGSRLTGVTGSGTAWGQVTGTLSNQTDLQNELDAKQDLDAQLTSLAGLTPGAEGRLIESDGLGGFAMTNVADITIDHVNLSNIGTNTHAQIDTHIASAAIHFTSAALWTDINQNATDITTTSGALNDISGAYYTHVASGAIHDASSAIIAVFDGAGSVIASGAQVDVQIPYSCRITRGAILPDASGSFTVNIWKDTYANFPPTSADSVDDIILTSNTKAEDTSLSVAVTSGDIIRLNASGASDTLTRATVVLDVRKE